LAWREAQTQTYADIFLVIAICFVVATVLVPAMHKVRPEPTPATGDAH
jgi:DHA2 family multidrug resistance protein